MQLRPTSQALVRLGIALLVVAAGASVWELLAAQAPHSPYQVGVLPGPVAQLRHAAVVYGLCSVALAWLLPWLSPNHEPRRLVAGVYLGVIVTLGALTYGAATGMMGIQINDPRTDAEFLFMARATGQGVLMLCLLDVGRRAFRRR